MGQPVEWVLNNVSHLELEGWAKYYEYLADARKRTANKGSNNVKR